MGNIEKFDCKLLCALKFMSGSCNDLILNDIVVFAKVGTSRSDHFEYVHILCMYNRYQFSGLPTPSFLVSFIL